MWAEQPWILWKKPYELLLSNTALTGVLHAFWTHLGDTAVQRTQTLTGEEHN